MNVNAYEASMLVRTSDAPRYLKPWPQVRKVLIDLRTGNQSEWCLGSCAKLVYRTPWGDEPGGFYAYGYLPKERDLQRDLIRAGLSHRIPDCHGEDNTWQDGSIL